MNEPIEERRSNLKIIDTTNSLTVEELKELKKLVAMTKTSKALLAICLGIIALFGVDKVVDFMQKGH